MQGIAPPVITRSVVLNHLIDMGYAESAISDSILDEFVAELNHLYLQTEEAADLASLSNLDIKDAENFGNDREKVFSSETGNGFIYNDTKTGRLAKNTKHTNGALLEKKDSGSHHTAGRSRDSHLRLYNESDAFLDENNIDDSILLSRDEQNGEFSEMNELVVDTVLMDKLSCLDLGPLQEAVHLQKHKHLLQQNKLEKSVYSDNDAASTTGSLAVLFSHSAIYIGVHPLETDALVNPRIPPPFPCNSQAQETRSC